jgi:hypothetical protein
MEPRQFDPFNFYDYLLDLLTVSEEFNEEKARMVLEAQKQCGEKMSLSELSLEVLQTWWGLLHKDEPPVKTFLEGIVKAAFADLATEMQNKIMGPLRLMFNKWVELAEMQEDLFIHFIDPVKPIGELDNFGTARFLTNDVSRLLELGNTVTKSSVGKIHLSGLK